MEYTIGPDPIKTPIPTIKIENLVPLKKKEDNRITTEIIIPIICALLNSIL